MDVSTALANILLSATITAATEGRPFPLAPGLSAEPTGPACGKADRLAARARHRALSKAGIRSAELSLHSLRHSYAVAVDALAAAFGRPDGQQMDSRASANPSPEAVEAA